MDVLGWHAVDFSFGDGDALEDRQGALFDEVGELAVFDQLTNLRVGAAVFVFVLVVLVIVVAAVVAVLVFVSMLVLVFAVGVRM
jgi:hypothetical protein